MTDQNTTPAQQLAEEFTPPAPKVEEFNLDEWMATGDAGRATKQITVYRDTSMLEEAQKLQAEVNLHNRRKGDDNDVDPDAAMGEANPAEELERRLADLEERISASKVTVEIMALSEEDREQIEDTFKQRYPGEKRQCFQTVKGTCLALAHKTDLNGRLTPVATFGGKHLSADQWRGLQNGSLAGGQWAMITDTLVNLMVKRPRVDSPFSRNG